MKPDRVELFFKEGTSDKVYIAELSISKASGELWDVSFQYGRRGSTLVPGVKGSGLSYERAKKTFDSLVKSTISKGYKASAAATVSSEIVEAENRDTGYRAQLLNEVNEAKVDELILDDSYCAQEKWDGRRIAIGMKAKDLKWKGLHVDSIEGVFTCNKKGQSKAFTARLKKAVDDLKVTNFIMDGESIGDTVHAFDYNGAVNGDLDYKIPYSNRYKTLLTVLQSSKQKDIIPVYTAWTAKEKRDLYEKLKKDGREGIVFKRIDAPYTPGRPNSGGDQFKFKFRKDISVIVQKVNGTKRSVAIYVLDGCNPVPCGNVTIPPNKEIPGPGDVIDVKYLYAFPREGGGGTLYQPVYIGPRDDVDKFECTIERIKFKSIDTEEEEDA